MLGNSRRGGYKPVMGCHRPQRTSRSLAIKAAARRAPAGALVADRPAAAPQTAVEKTASPPRRSPRRTFGEARVPAAPAVRINIEANGSEGDVNDRCDGQNHRRVAAPAAGPLTARRTAGVVGELTEPAGAEVPAAAANAWAGPWPDSAGRRGATDARGRPHSAVA